MKAAVDSVGFSIVDPINFGPAPIVQTGVTSVIKYGSGQQFRFKIGCTVVNVSDGGTGNVLINVCSINSIGGFRLDYLALELLTLTGGSTSMAVEIIYNGKSCVSSNVGWPSFRRWTTMAEHPGTDAGTGGQAADNYFLSTNGTEALFYGGSFLTGALQVKFENGAATWTANSTFNLHMSGVCIGG